MLEIKNLHVKLEEEDKQILKGVDLTVEAGQGARDHGAERLGQVDAVLRAVGARRL
jgi:ABC-type branched-subunit amino acid transport system ATPase component